MNDHTTKVLAFCLEEIPSAIVGVEKVLKYLNKKQSIDFRFRRSVEVKKADIVWADVVIAIRSSESIEVNIIEQAKKNGRYIIYFLDDDLLNIPKESLSAVYFQQTNIRDNITKNIRNADTLWTTNENIKSKYGVYTKSSHVIHVPIEDDDICTFQDDNKKKQEIIIGFAGSKDHGEFLEILLKDALLELSKQYKDTIRFEFFGAKPKFIEGNQLFTYIEYEDNYVSYRKKMSELNWDIALAPLIQSDFHGCKYFNKYIEYSSLGIPAIYSNVAPYIFVVKNRVNGILANNSTKVWKKAIMELVDDFQLRKTIVENSQKQLTQEFTMDFVTDSLIQKIPQIINYKAPLCREKNVKMGNVALIHYYYRVREIIIMHGWKTPGVIIVKLGKKIKHIVKA